MQLSECYEDSPSKPLTFGPVSVTQREPMQGGCLGPLYMRDLGGSLQGAALTSVHEKSNFLNRLPPVCGS